MYGKGVKKAGTKKLYIPHGSDNTDTIVEKFITVTPFISHMVQIIPKAIGSASLAEKSFISHMVQIIQVIAVDLFKRNSNFISYMVQSQNILQLLSYHYAQCFVIGNAYQKDAFFKFSLSGLLNFVIRQAKGKVFEMF